MEERHELVDLAVAIERIPRPRRGEVAPLREIPRGLAQTVHGSVLAAECRSAQRTPHALGWLRQDLLQPAPECLVEEARRGRLGQHLEERIDAGFDRALAQKICAEGVDRADVRLFELRQRPIEPRPRLVIVADRHARAVELFPQPQLQLARGLLREGDGDDPADVRLALGDDADDAADERRGLAGAGRGFDDERRVESVGDEVAGLGVGQRWPLAPGTLFSSLMASPAAL